jgi:hypothetical protein
MFIPVIGTYRLKRTALAQERARAVSFGVDIAGVMPDRQRFTNAKARTSFPIRSVLARPVAPA